MSIVWMLSFFFFNDTATTEIYTLSLHDALPISNRVFKIAKRMEMAELFATHAEQNASSRSEEHTSELQSQSNLVCRLLLEKKKTELETIYYKSLCRTRPMMCLSHCELCLSTSHF